MRFTHVLTDLLASGRTVRFTATGGSMHPLIRHGDALVVAPLSRTPLLGDILLYLACGRPIAHRLIAVESNGDGPLLILKGNSAAWPDLPVRLEQVVGKVVAAERQGFRIDPYDSGTRLLCVPRAAAVAIKAALLKYWNTCTGGASRSR